MYNRYTPQADGTYQKNRLSEPEQQSIPPLPDPPSYAFPPFSQDLRPGKAVGIGEFLKKLLPENLDIEDLIVILLLILMSEEEQADRNQAMLTLASYLFL